MSEGGPGRRWPALLAEVPPAVMAVGVLVLFGVTVAGRINYPFDLEWMEGGMLLHAQRVLDGQPLFVRPTPDFIPYLYPPLYSWLLAALTWLPGVELSLTLGRLVSVVGTLGAAGALVAAARQERAPWGLALGGAALYLSCYDETGAFFDLVRIDGMFMALLTWSLVAARGGWLRSAGLLLTLAYATKHNGAAFGLPVLVWLAVARGRTDALRFALWSLVPALSFTAAMQVASEGQFLTWMLRVPSSHGMVAQRLFPGALTEMIDAFPLVLGVAGLIGLAWIRRWSAGGAYWLMHGAVALVLCSVMRGHTGGFLNVLMPGHWTLALLGVCALAALARRHPHPMVLGGAGALVALQIFLGRWSPAQYTPTAEDEKIGWAVVEEIRALPGEVLSPYAPYLPVLAGKKPYFHLIALWDIDHKDGPYKSTVNDLERALADHQWDAILVTGKEDFGHGMRQAYKRSGRLTVPPNRFMPKTGWRARPQIIYTPRTAEDPAPVGADEPQDGQGGPETAGSED